MGYAVVLGEALVDLLDSEYDGRAGLPAGHRRRPLNVAVGGGPARRRGAVRRFARRRRAGRPDPRLPDRRRRRAGRCGHRAGADRAGGGHLRRRRTGLPLLRRAALVRACSPPTTWTWRWSRAPTCSTAARSCCSDPARWPPPGGPGRSPLACGSSTRTCAPRLLDGPDALAGLREVVAEFAAGAHLVKLSTADAGLLYPGRAGRGGGRVPAGVGRGARWWSPSARPARWSPLPAPTRYGSRRRRSTRWTPPAPATR